MSYKKKLSRLGYGVLIAVFVIPLISKRSEAQIGNNLQGYQFNQPQIQGLYRLVEPGQLADTLSLWGDTGLHGRVMIPRNMNLVQLISYAGGPGAPNIAGGGQTIGRQLNWSHEKVYVRVNRYDRNNRRYHLQQFTFQYNRPLPESLENYQLHNNDVITVQVRQKPSPLDYIQVFGITIGSVTAILLVANRFGVL